MALLSWQVLPQVHQASYVDSFCQHVLSEAEMKRIGFGALCLQPILVERTLAEIAGDGALCSKELHVTGQQRISTHAWH